MIKKTLKQVCNKKMATKVCKNENTITYKSVSIIIDQDNACQRIDNFLFNKLKNIPKSRVYKMLRGGEVRVNKARVACSYKLQSQDLIRVPPYWATSKANGNIKYPPKTLVNLLLNRVIFEDNRILAVNKPFGVASHGGSGINFGVIETLRHARGDLRQLELVHRLDRDTSGCLILAKKRSALRELHHLIREGKILKEYILLVRGSWVGGSRIVDLPLLKNVLQSCERVVKVNSGGKASLTIFRPIKTGLTASLLSAELKTGRTHQIRVHASSIGYPIAGDEKYGDREFNRIMKRIGLNRLFLHAERIKFIWDDGDKIDITASLDPQLENVVSKIFT